MAQNSEAPATLEEYKKSTMHILKDFFRRPLTQEEKDKIKSLTTKAAVESYKWELIHKAWGD